MLARYRSTEGKSGRLMSDTGYIYEATDGAPIKHWTRGVELEDAAHEQLRNVALLPFIHKHVAAMPDVHWGIGATIGSVIATKGAIIPAAVGVDIGCDVLESAQNAGRPLERELHEYVQSDELVRCTPELRLLPSSPPWKMANPAYSRRP